MGGGFYIAMRSISLRAALMEFPALMGPSSRWVGFVLEVTRWALSVGNSIRIGTSIGNSDANSVLGVGGGLIFQQRKVHPRGKQ